MYIFLMLPEKWTKKFDPSPVSKLEVGIKILLNSFENFRIF